MLLIVFLEKPSLRSFIKLVSSMWEFKEFKSVIILSFKIDLISDLKISKSFLEIKFCSTDNLSKSYLN